MIQTKRTSYYPRRLTDYSYYTRTSRSSGTSNSKSVLAKKIIIQSLACIVIIFLITWLQSRVDETPKKIVSQIRSLVVENHITPDDIYQSFADTYEECVEYIQGAD